MHCPKLGTTTHHDFLPGWLLPGEKHPNLSFGSRLEGLNESTAINMVALKFALAFALVSISVSNPIEELGIEDEDFVKKGRNAEEDEEAARNARFNFGYSIQVWQFLSS